MFVTTFLKTASKLSDSGFSKNLRIYKVFFIENVLKYTFKHLSDSKKMKTMSGQQKVHPPPPKLRIPGETMPLKEKK
jgi:hypothetical protein